MTSVAPPSAQLAEFGRLSRCSIRSAHNGSPKEVRLATTQPRKSRASRKRALSLSAAKLKEKDEMTEKPIYDEGMFNTNFRCGVTEEEKTEAFIDTNSRCGVTEEEKTEDRQANVSAGYGSGGLIPEDWKYIQQDLHLTKLEKKKQFKLQQMENAQLNELRAELQRQKIDLLSSTERPPTDPSWTGRPQLLDRMQLLELERELSLKAAGKKTLDEELDEMFTFNEKHNLKRWIPDFSQAHCRKWPLLHVLATSGQSFFLEQFLKFGVEVNEEDEDGYMPLQRAVQGRKETTVSQLLYAGAHVDVYDKDGASLLHLSVQVGSLSLVRLFVRRGVPVNHADQYGWTPLHLAVMIARADIVRHLIVSGADKSLETKDGLTPLDIATALGKGLKSYSVSRCLKTLSRMDLRA